MHRLTLDFLHPLPRPHWAAWLLLAVGLGLAAWVGWQDQQVVRALAVAAAESPAPRTPPPAQRATRAATGEAQTGAAESAQAQLATPWGELFGWLETNRPARIALLSLDADARKADVTLTAEARSVKDMLAWIEQLKGEAGFHSVTLASHTVQDADPQRPIRFVLRLGWKR